MLTVLSLLFCIFANTAFASTTFKDVSSNHWASKAIEEMHAAGVINGYPDGTFKPDAPVTRLHAIIMLVRANNLQKAVEEYDLNNSPYEFPPGISEASKKYLAVAADKGWIIGERMKAMKPNNAASREEIAALIGAAFDLKGDFEKLPFADKNYISVSIRHLVAGVYEAGIMKGKSAAKFYPKSQIKRSELAVIFMRLSDKGKINPAPGKRIDGYLKEYNSAINRIKIQSTDGITRALTLHPNALVYIGDVKSSPSALRINQLLRLYLNEHNQVVFLKTIDSITPSSTVSYTEDKASGDDKKYWGYVYELKPNKLKLKLLSDDYRTFSLSENLVLYDENNKRKSLLALNKDDFIELELSQNKIVEIRITQYSEVVGNIYRLRNDWITISRHGRLYSYSICEHTTKFTDTDGDEYEYHDLKEGYKVKVILAGDKALKIEVLNKNIIIAGTIDDLYNQKDDERDWEIRIKDIHGRYREYDVDSGVEVYDVDGNEIYFWRLDEDDQDDTVLYLDRNNDEVEVIKLAKIDKGTITDLDEDDIKIDNTWYDLPKNFDITGYIIGSEVEVYVNDDQVEFIHVTDAEDITVEGKVRNIDADNYKITIRQESGNEFIFDVEKRVEIEDEVDNEKVELDDLKHNWEVRLVLDNGEVEKIIITDK